jgi:hypothetical protein
MKTKLINLLFILPFCVHLCVAQVTYVDKDKVMAFKNASDVVVLLANEDPKTIKKLSKKKSKLPLDNYKKTIRDYNIMLKEEFDQHWTFTKIRYETTENFSVKLLSGEIQPKQYVISLGNLTSVLANLCMESTKNNEKIIDLDQRLVHHDEQCSLDIMPVTTLDAYFTKTTDWENQQKKKISLDKKLGKNTSMADYLKHRSLEFVGFYLSQHNLMTSSDLKFALHYLQEDFNKIAKNPKNSLVNQMPIVQKQKLASKTLLIGQDLVFSPEGKVSLDSVVIKSNFPLSFQIVAQSKIESALKEHNPNYAVVIPSTRWSPTGYPELLLFWVVDATDGVSILSFADTGSGSNAMTANNFERSTELKAKHFKEFLENAE